MREDSFVMSGLISSVEIDSELLLVLLLSRTAQNAKAPGLLGRWSGVAQPQENADAQQNASNNQVIAGRGSSHIREDKEPDQSQA